MRVARDLNQLPSKLAAFVLRQFVGVKIAVDSPERLVVKEGEREGKDKKKLLSTVTFSKKIFHCPLISCSFPEDLGPYFIMTWALHLLLPAANIVLMLFWMVTEPEVDLHIFLFAWARKVLQRPIPG